MAKKVFKLSIRLKLIVSHTRTSILTLRYLSKETIVFYHSGIFVFIPSANITSLL